MMVRRVAVTLLLLLICQAPLSQMAVAQTDPDFERSLYLVELELMEAFSAIALSWDNSLDVLDLRIPHKPLLVIVQPGEEVTIEGCGAPVRSTDGEPRFCVFEHPIPGIQVTLIDQAADEVARDIETNGIIVIPLEWLTDFKGARSNTQFRLAVGLFLAHEFGHFVQIELSEQLSRPLPLGKQAELLSDCFAGDVFATAGRSVFRNSGNSPITLLKVFESIGAQEPDSTHGTPIERRDAFTFGYAYGTIDADSRKIQGKLACISRFWPALLGNSVQ